MLLSGILHARRLRGLAIAVLVAGAALASLPPARAAAATGVVVTLTASTQSSLAGNPVTLTAVVDGGGTGPAVTGNVSFTDFAPSGSTDLGTSAVDGQGHASLTTSTLSVGNHTVQATYLGDADHSANSGSTTLQVRVATTVSLATSASSVTNGTIITLTATVATADSGIPGGAVVVSDGATVGYAYLGASSPGVAVLMTARLSAGTHHLTATYSGDGHYATSVSAGTVDVTVALGSTTTALTSSLNPSATNGSVSITARVGEPSLVDSLSIASDAGDPIGSGQTLSYSSADSTFAYIYGRTTVSRGADAWTFALSGATQTAIGTYTEDSNSLWNTPLLRVSANGRSCTRVTGTLTINALDIDSTTTQRGWDLTFEQHCDGAAAALRGHLVVATANVPTGTMAFSDGQTSLGTVALDASGTATLTTSTLTTGSHSITAAYAGDGDHLTSSGSMTQQVALPTDGTSLTTSPNPSLSLKSVLLTASVTHSTGGPVPTGSVTFLDGTTVLGTAPVDGTGHAQLGSSALAAGSHSLTAEYGGDATYAASTSTALSQTVNRGSVTMSSPTPNNSTDASSSIVSVFISPDTPQPTGTVDFYENGQLLQAGIAVGSGMAEVTVPALAPGDYSFDAVYSGDANFLGTTTSRVVQVRVPVWIRLHSYTNPSVPGQAVHILATFDYAASPAPSGPTGTVTFHDGGVTALATVPVDQYGQALLSTTALGAGTHSITAFYSGDGSYFDTSGLYGGSDTELQTVAAASPNRRFVNQLYNDVLDRAADGGAAGWAAALDNHSIDRTHVALDLVGSTEYITDQIESSYNAHLGRDADGPGLAYWLGYIQKGGTYEQLEVSFLGTPEYYRNAGGTDDAYLDALYGDVFGRTIDGPGRTYWDARLAAGTPLWQVAMSVVMSNEAMSNRVTNMYLWYLGRPPDSGGLAYWVGLLQHGTRDEALAALLAGSDEYWKDTQGG